MLSLYNTCCVSYLNVAGVSYCDFTAGTVFPGALFLAGLYGWLLLLLCASGLLQAAATASHCHRAQRTPTSMLHNSLSVNNIHPPVSLDGNHA